MELDYSQIVEFCDEKFKECFHKKAELFTKFDELTSRKLMETHQCKMNYCYYNAWMAAVSDSTLKYYEGFIFINSTNLNHAWLVLDDKVIDPTLIITERADRYLGLHIPTDFVSKIARQKNNADSVLYDYLEKESLK